MFEQLSNFEENPYRKINFATALLLLNEVGSIASEIRLNWFVKNHFKFSDTEKMDVLSWIDRLHDVADRVIESEDTSMIIKANIDTFSDDLDNITDYLIERMND